MIVRVCVVSDCGRAIISVSWLTFRYASNFDAAHRLAKPFNSSVGQSPIFVTTDMEEDMDMNTDTYGH